MKSYNSKHKINLNKGFVVNIFYQILSNRAHFDSAPPDVSLTLLKNT